MTSATLIYSDDTYDLEISGHSGYADRGSDIVCAAVSAVALALCEYIKTQDCKSEIEVKDGYVRICAHGNFGDAVTFTECAFKPICSETFGYVEFSSKKVRSDGNQRR